MIAAQFIIGFVVTAVLVTTLLVQDRYTYGKWYSLAVFALGVLLIAIAALALRSTPTASIAVAACNCFNLVVWAMLAYLVFQAEAGALQVFGFGNAALSGGTAFASFTIMALDITSGTYDDIMRAALIVLGVIVLVDLMFVFSEKQINELLVPLDQPRKAQDTLVFPNANQNNGCSRARPLPKRKGCLNESAKCSWRSPAARRRRKLPTATCCPSTPCALIFVRFMQSSTSIRRKSLSSSWKRG